jgi:hypothetical protein
VKAAKRGGSSSLFAAFLFAHDERSEPEMPTMKRDVERLNTTGRGFWLGLNGAVPYGPSMDTLTPLITRLANRIIGAPGLAIATPASKVKTADALHCMIDDAADEWLLAHGSTAKRGAPDMGHLWEAPNELVWPYAGTDSVVGAILDDVDFVVADLEQGLAYLDAMAAAVCGRLHELLREPDQHRPELLAIARSMGLGAPLIAGFPDTTTRVDGCWPRRWARFPRRGVCPKRRRPRSAAGDALEHGHGDAHGL